MTPTRHLLRMNEWIMRHILINEHGLCLSLELHILLLTRIMWKQKPPAHATFSLCPTESQSWCTLPSLHQMPCELFCFLANVKKWISAPPIHIYIYICLEHIIYSFQIPYSYLITSLMCLFVCFNDQYGLTFRKTNNKQG